MRYACQRRSPPPLTLAASLRLFGLALFLLAPGGHAADAAPPVANDTSVKITAFPPAVHVTTAAAKDDAASGNEGKADTGKPRVRIDTDHDFDPFSNEMLQNTPWVIGLVFLVVGSIFLTPIVLLVGIIWYKLRKARLQNEAMLALAEKGVVPPGQAAAAIAASEPPASVAPQAYQQAMALRKRVVWSDLRKGVILSMIGLAFSFYWLVSDREASWVGLILLFVGVGYVVLWWLEGRQLDETRARAGSNDTTPGASGG